MTLISSWYLDTRAVVIVMLELVAIGHLDEGVAILADNVFDDVDVVDAHVVHHALHQGFVGSGAIVHSSGVVVNDLLVGADFHESLALAIAHHPRLLHADGQTALHAAVLAALAAALGDGAGRAQGALVLLVDVVLHRAPEEGLARVAGQAAEVEALGHVAAHPARFHTHAALCLHVQLLISLFLS